MNIKKLLIGGIVGAIVYFLLGWLIYEKLLVDFFNHHPGVVTGYNRTQPLFLYLVIGNLLAGFLLAYILAKANVNSVGSGLTTGGIVGFLMASSTDCIVFGTTLLVGRYAVAADVIAFTIMSAIVGAIIGTLPGSND